jgi:hypothetical protein
VNQLGPIELLIILVVGLVPAIGSAAIARSKGRSWIGWAILGFLLSLIALVVVAVLPARRSQTA